MIYYIKACIYTLIANSLWNNYSLISHFYLALNFETKFLTYSIPAIILFMTVIMEMKIIYGIFIKNNPNLVANPTMLKRKILIFYLIYHIFLFYLICNVNTFFVEDFGIALSALTIYIPYILSNTFKVKVKHPPILIILSYTINRCYLPFYFKADKNNIFHIHSNPKLVFLILFSLVFQHLFIYLQVIFGGDFYICSNYLKMKLRIADEESNAKSYSYNKLLKIKDQYKNIDCPICLQPILVNETIENSSNYQLSEQNLNESNSNLDSKLQVDFDQSFNQSLDTTINNVNISDSKIKTHFKLTMNFIFRCFFEYHYVKCSQIKNEFIITNCKHAFHRTCLVEWIEQKSECPIDRTKIIFDE